MRRLNETILAKPAAAGLLGPYQSALAVQRSELQGRTVIQMSHRSPNGFEHPSRVGSGVDVRVIGVRIAGGVRDVSTYSAICLTPSRIQPLAVVFVSAAAGRNRGYNAVGIRTSARC